jgi:hypothetical protein
MALVDLTKQLAAQALTSATKEASPSTPAPTAPAEALGSVILAQIAAMQKALKEDDELAVWVHNGAERIRVVEIFLPSPRLMVVTGFDPERVLTRVIAPADTLQLVTKVLKVHPGAKPARVNLITPKPKE